MFPELFKIPGLGWPINSYGFCIMVGFLLASWIAVRRGRPLGLKSDFVLDVGIIGMIAGILAAKITYLFQYPKDLAEPGKLSLWGDPGLNPLGALVLGPLPFAFWFWRMRKSGEKVVLFSWQTGVLLVLTFILALLGTRALFLWTHSTEYSWKLFRNWQSGFVLYGGLVGGVAAGALYVKMRGHSVALVADLVAPMMMLAVGFGRLGCFMNGCCHGKPGTGFPCIAFPEGSPAARLQNKSFGQKADPVHPTQLYETAATIAMFFLLSWLYRRKRKAQGEVFLVTAMLYGAWRFMIEFARGDERPVWLGELSNAQVISLAIFTVSGIWLFLLRNRPEPPPAETPKVPESAPTSASTAP
jgi:phosphatidylglycerol:prolipoprotein diacylglycerol transferase